MYVKYLILDKKTILLTCFSKTFRIFVNTKNQKYRVF